MDFGLPGDDADQDLLISTIRRFVEREIRPMAADADRTGQIPQGVLKKAGELGFLLDGVPEKEGGLCEESYNHVARALRGFELGNGCSALAALLETNVEASLAVGRWGSPEARRMLFGSLSAGNLAAYWHDAAGRFSIAAGSSGIEVTGITGPIPALATASWLLVACDGETPALFLMPVQGESVKKLVPSGWRAAAWGRVEFDRVAVPNAQVLARGEQARTAIAEVQSWYNVSMAARALGVARAAIAHARAYGADRIQFGQPIGTFESLRQICDDNETLIEAAWLLTRKAAWQIDRAHADARDSASRARNLAAQVVSRAAIDAVQVHGGYGFVNDFPVEKLMRDAPAYAVLGGDEGFARQTSGGGGN